MRERVVRLAAAVALACVCLCATAAVALAAPNQPTMGLTELKAQLSDSASGTLDGYMATVVKGSAITTIPCTVEAVSGSGDPSTSLILFEATGPLIGKYGGIVAGMSGSPLYVVVGGQPKLVGAVSYGDYFTLSGTALATPIEAMEALESKYSPGVQMFDSPVITSSGVVDRVVVTDEPQKMAGAAAEGAVVAKPLASIFVAGLPTTSRWYARLSKDFAADGMTLVAFDGASPAGGGDADESFTATLTGGAALGALEARGSLWAGGIGTVTYATTDTVLAFGHPAFWTGESGLYMTNAVVDGIWNNSYQPYKVARPGAVRGTITQDRSAGVMGVTNQLPAETTITAEATNADTGECTSTATYIPRKLLSTGLVYPDLPAAAASNATMKLFDQASTPGSVAETTTLVFRDIDANKTYTVVIPEFYDDSYDMPGITGMDTFYAVGQLERLIPDDIYHVEVLSIDVATRASSHRKAAEIVDVSAPSPMQTGTNTVRVLLNVHGIAATQTLDVPFTLPEGVNTDGVVSVTDGADATSNSASDPSAWDGPTSPSQIASDLASTVPSNVLLIEYTEASPAVTSGALFTAVSSSGHSKSLADLIDDLLGGGGSGDTWTPKTVDETVTTQWALSGGASSWQPDIMVESAGPVAAYASAQSIAGFVDGPSAPGTMTVYATPANSTHESVLGTASIDPNDGSFTFAVGGFAVNTRIRLHAEWALYNLTSDTSYTVFVAPKLSFSSSSASVKHGKTVQLTAAVVPLGNMGAKVRFDRYSSKTKKWSALGTRTLGSATAATLAWKVPKGTSRLRVRFLGSKLNAPVTSRVLVVKGR